MDKVAREITSAALSVRDWVRALGISEATFYNVVLADRPKSTYAGRRLLIVEAPIDWLSRMERQGGARTIKRERKTPRATSPSARRQQDAELLARPTRRAR